VLMAEAHKQKSAESRRALIELAKKFLPYAAALLLAVFAKDANCKQLQFSTNPILHNTSIVYKGVRPWRRARRLLAEIFQRVTRITSWSFRPVVSLQAV